MFCLFKKVDIEEATVAKSNESRVGIALRSFVQFDHLIRIPTARAKSKGMIIATKATNNLLIIG